ncbi:hypothetical protein [Salinicola tamaricis]|uniref:hypothetical protein n=1 Tax=Salinicola tamaricis TaxID=1771309 RepID=UPI003BF54507
MPPGGGVGLCEYTQHISMFDYIAVSGSLEGRLLEYVDHLHEHFEARCRSTAAAIRYRMPRVTG